MPLKLRDTFFLKGTGGVNNPDGAHLMVCIAAHSPTDRAIIIPVVSRHAFSDASCILNVGDHPFITHESCAAYDHGQCVSLKEISAQIDSGKIKLQDKISPELLVRFQVGLVKSDETEPRLFNAAEGTQLTAFLKHKGYL